MKPHLSDRLRYFDARIGSPIAVEAADRLEALERENERLTIQAAVTETARRAAERHNAELEAALQFYAAKESYRNRTVDEQRQLNGGVDPVVARSDVGRAPAGTALSDIQMDNHGDRARAALAGSRQLATHRHKKRGTEYVLIGIGKMQAEDWHESDVHYDAENDVVHKIVGGSVDMREVAIYRSVDDGSLWARPREEFEDGRFEPITAAQEGR